MKGKTVNTRQAIIEMRKRGYTGEEIIDMAKRLQRIERVFFGNDTSLAVSLVLHVRDTPNYRWCWNCNDYHHIQNCWQLGVALKMDTEQFEMFQAANRVMEEMQMSYDPPTDAPGEDCPDHGPNTGDCDKC
jgi:hypothetical protein